jgi:hypothetical protein
MKELNVQVSPDFSGVIVSYCKEKDVVFLAFAPLDHVRPGPLEEPSGHFGKLPQELERRQHRCCWLGRWSVARPCLLLRGLRLARGKILISALPEEGLMKSSEFRQAKV